MSSTSTNISANTHAHDKSLHTDANDVFKPDAWASVSRFAKDVVEVLPCNTPAYNTWTDFDMPESAELLGAVTLRLNSGHGTTSIAGTGGSAWVSGLGYQIWEEMRIQAGSKIVQEVFSDSQRYLDSLIRDIRDEDADAVTYYQSRSLADRQADFLLADNSQDLLIRCPFYFTDSIKKYLFTPALSRELRIRVRFRSLDACLFSGAGSVNTATMSNVALIAQYWHLPSNHRDELMDSVYNRGQAAIPFLMRDEQHHHDELIPAAATTYTLKLSNIRQPMTSLVFALRSDADSSKVAGEKAPDAVLDVVSEYEVRDGNVLIVPTIQHDYDQYIIRRQYWKGQPGNGVYGWSMALDPMDKSNATGHVNAHSYSNMTLKLTFSAPLAAATRLYVVAETNNFATIVNGHAIKAWH